MPLKVAYWPLKGRAFPTRCLLHHAGIEFEDYFIEKEKWFGEEKPALYKEAKPLPMPSIPYIQDGEDYIFQSNAVLRYAGRKAGYCATTENQRILEDTLEGVLAEISEAAIKARFGGSDPATALKEFVDGFAGKVKAINQVLKNSKFLTGDQPSWIDFSLLGAVEVAAWAGKSSLREFIQQENSELADVFRLVSDLLANQNLNKYIESVAQVPALPPF